MQHSGESRAARRPVVRYQIAGGATVLAAMLAGSVGAASTAGSPFHAVGIGPAADTEAGTGDHEQVAAVASRPGTQLDALAPAPTDTGTALPVSVMPAGFTDATPDGRARLAVAFALAQLGLPYVWGGNGPAAGHAGFDCSGLTTEAYKAAGITLPRTAHTQYYHGPHLPAGATLLPGDLVFYGVPSRIHHVGMYLGEGRMVAAPTFGKPVRVSYFRWNGDDYLGATRPAAAPGSIYEGFLLTVPPPASGPSSPSAVDDEVFDAPPAPVTPELLEAAVAPPAAPAPPVAEVPLAVDPETPVGGAEGSVDPSTIPPTTGPTLPPTTAPPATPPTSTPTTPPSTEPTLPPATTPPTTPPSTEPSQVTTSEPEAPAATPAEPAPVSRTEPSETVTADPVPSATSEAATSESTASESATSGTTPSGSASTSATAEQTAVATTTPGADTGS